MVWRLKDSNSVGTRYQLEISKETSQIEIDQLQEALNYCYKTICIACHALSVYGFANKINDLTNVKAEIMKDYVSRIP